MISFQNWGLDKLDFQCYEKLYHVIEKNQKKKNEVIMK